MACENNNEKKNKKKAIQNDSRLRPLGQFWLRRASESILIEALNPRRNESTRRAAAQHDDATESVIRMAIQDSSYQVRRMGYYNKKAPAEIICSMVDSFLDDIEINKYTFSEDWCTGESRACCDSHPEVGERLRIVENILVYHDVFTPLTIARCILHPLAVIRRSAADNKMLSNPLFAMAVRAHIVNAL